MKLITKENEATEFAKHVYQVGYQFSVQNELHSNLHQAHFYIHMDFVEDYHCRAQQEVQSVYWNTS